METLVEKQKNLLQFRPNNETTFLVVMNWAQRCLDSMDVNSAVQFTHLFSALKSIKDEATQILKDTGGDIIESGNLSVRKVDSFNKVYDDPILDDLEAKIKARKEALDAMGDFEKKGYSYFLPIKKIRKNE